MIAPPKRLLVIKPSSFGDIVQSLPVLAALRRGWPDSRIDWLVKEEWAGLLQNHPLIDQVVVLAQSITEWPRVLKRLRTSGYDMALDLQGLLRSGLLSLATGAPIRAGFVNAREGSPWCYTQRVPIASAAHAVECYLELIRGLGIATTDAITFPLPEWKREEQWVNDFLAERMAPTPKPFCVIHPAARWKTKQWPIERYAELADWLTGNRVYGVVLVAGPAQADQVSPMIARLRAPVVSLVARTTLPQLGALLRRAAFLITNDSGPMHLAAAVGTPVVAIFGPTDPRRVGPYGSGHVVLRKPFDCSRCKRNDCVQELQCLKAISVADVREAVEQLARRNLVCVPSSARDVSGSASQ
ncbi:MAG: glycosyltransferase family 9 protein [Candidatus Binatia bacterium]